MGGKPVSAPPSAHSPPPAPRLVSRTAREMEDRTQTGTFEVEDGTKSSALGPRLETIRSDKTFQQLLSGFSKARLVTYVGGPGEILDLFERDRFGSVGLIISENIDEVKGNTILIRSAGDFREWLPLAPPAAPMVAAVSPPLSGPTFGQRVRRFFGRDSWDWFTRLSVGQG